MSLPDQIKQGLACNTIADANTVMAKAVCLAAHPGKVAIFPLVHWFEARYRGKYRFARLVFLFDLFLVGLVAGLGLVALALHFYKPTNFSDKIFFNADIAPSEIVSGAPSTLIIRYTNGTGEELRDVKISHRFPEHFLLQELEGTNINWNTHEYTIDAIKPGETGSIKIRGVMFGDVGGEQTFRTNMTFVHGDKDTADYKMGVHTFSPTRSTLVLNLSLPEKIIAYQPVDGTLTYQNTGTIDFPEISVKPTWPAEFTFLSSDTPLSSGSFLIPALRAGMGGVVGFHGRLGAVEGEITFTFLPSFTFGDTSYHQETLTHTASVMPLPLQISHSVDSESLRPGGKARVTITYTNVGEAPVTNVQLGVETKNPFVSTTSTTVNQAQYPDLATVEPKETGTITIEIPLKRSIEQSQTSVYENIPFKTTATATFDMDGVTNAITRDSETTATMTSPVVLDTFARYTASSGDQLGRGPLPPIVDETTKYWIFWNVHGTTNTLTNVRIEGELGENVAFSGRQTVSQNGGVEYDMTTNSMVWTSTSLSPTLSPSSKIVGIAFELALTPSDDQLGSTPTLLKNIRITATDSVTGAFVSASGATITTNLPSDTLASGNAIVE